MPGRIVPEPPQPDRDPEHLPNSASWRAAPASPAWPCSAPRRGDRRRAAPRQARHARGLLDEVRQAEERLLGDTGA
jgi:hypothetical protein